VNEYEVRIDINGSVWITVEADDTEEAEEYARAAFMPGDLQWLEITDVDITLVPRETTAA